MSSGLWYAWKERKEGMEGCYLCLLCPLTYRENEQGGQRTALPTLAFNTRFFLCIARLPLDSLYPPLLLILQYGTKRSVTPIWRLEYHREKWSNYSTWQFIGREPLARAFSRGMRDYPWVRWEDPTCGRFHTAQTSTAVVKLGDSSS